MDRLRDQGLGINALCRLAGSVALLALGAMAQPEVEMQRLAMPRLLELSPDASRLWYKLGTDWWEIGTAPDTTPKPAKRTERSQEEAPMTSTRRSKDESSPDGKRVAYLGAERPYGPTLLLVGEGAATAKPVSRMPITAFHWGSDSQSLWVIGADGADEPVGQLWLDGRFQKVSGGAAQRRPSGLAAASGVIAWSETDGKHVGRIWMRNRSGAMRVLADPNPQAARYSSGTQQVIRWRNGHDEELQGVLARPAGGNHFPLLVDPYSSWRNRYLNIPVLGNYWFVQQGFAVFFPNHRAVHGFPEYFFGWRAEPGPGGGWGRRALTPPATRYPARRNRA